MAITRSGFSFIFILAKPILAAKSEVLNRIGTLLIGKNRVG
ncbi:MAG: hypothetical protein ACI8Z9_000106 [Paraglaciecola sp.]|jgi:hypothetical protein